MFHSLFVFILKYSFIVIYNKFLSSYLISNRISKLCSAVSNSSFIRIKLSAFAPFSS